MSEPISHSDVPDPKDSVDPSAIEDSKTQEPLSQPNGTITYDSLLVTLKDKTKELKKKETILKKLEDRYKEKVK